MCWNGGRGVKAATFIVCSNIVITDTLLKFANTAIQHACSAIASDNRAKKLKKGKSGWFSTKQYWQKTGQKQ
jgi:hypothetical protein